MFKKLFKKGLRHPVSNKDRKNLRNELLKLEYDENTVQYLLQDKNYDEDSALTVEKI
jgi:hypothetical protein